MIAGEAGQVCCEASGGVLSLGVEHTIRLICAPCQRLAGLPNRSRRGPSHRALRSSRVRNKRGAADAVRRHSLSTEQS